MANPFAKIRLFYQETKTELKKSAWPTRLELKDNTVVVLIAVCITGVVLFVSDWSIFSWITLLTQVARPEIG